MCLIKHLLYFFLFKMGKRHWTTGNKSIGDGAIGNGAIGNRLLGNGGWGNGECGMGQWGMGNEATGNVGWGNGVWGKWEVHPIQGLFKYFGLFFELQDIKLSYICNMVYSNVCENFFKKCFKDL